MTIRFWDPETCQPTGQRFQQHSIVQDLAFHPNGKLLAAGYSDGTVRLLELTTGLPCGPAMKHDQFVTSVTFNKDGTLLASGSFDRTARIWQVPEWFDDLHEMELRTWVALGARLNDQGTVEPIPWQEWRDLREELRAPKEGQGRY